MLTATAALIEAILVKVDSHGNHGNLSKIIAQHQWQWSQNGWST